jgi:thioredoxin reductase (NADPH)
VILATDPDYERPAITDMGACEGSGVSYCIGCDAYLYRESPVAVVKTGNYAAQESLMFLNYTDDVRLQTNGPLFEADHELGQRVNEAGIPVSPTDLRGWSATGPSKRFAPTTATASRQRGCSPRAGPSAE